MMRNTTEINDIMKEYIIYVNKYIKNNLDELDGKNISIKKLGNVLNNNMKEKTNQLRIKRILKKMIELMRKFIKIYFAAIMENNRNMGNEIGNAFMKAMNELEDNKIPNVSGLKEIINISKILKTYKNEGKEISNTTISTITKQFDSIIKLMNDFNVARKWSNNENNYNQSKKILDILGSTIDLKIKKNKKKGTEKKALKKRNKTAKNRGNK
tara:strand:+ start:351 stop:986 length:636 start_codon:yes stop_codon:yes gene_type:complete